MPPTITKSWVGTLCPTAGRDYANGKLAREAFYAGHDFKLMTPFSDSVCSIRDFAPGVECQLRFKRLTGLTTIKVPTPKPTP